MHDDFVKQFEIDETTINNQVAEQQKNQNIENKIQALSNPRLSVNLTTNAAANDV
jgi:hypothetical protein